MVVALMPGWQRVPDWSESNKKYVSPGEYVEREPLKIVPEEELRIYEVRFNKIINLFLSPGDTIEITRIFEENYYKEIRAIEYPEGLDKWIEDILVGLCDANWDRTNFEVGGGFVKPSLGAIGEGLKSCETEIIFKRFTPPTTKPKVPKYILEQITFLEERYLEAESIDEKYAIREEINSLKKRYGIE